MAWKILERLRDHGDEVVGLVIHPPSRRSYGEQLVAAAALDASRIFEAEGLEERSVLRSIRELDPEIGLSVLFGYILRPEFLKLLPAGCVNVHPAFLPFNRGAYPNVWSIVEGTPAGVTLHYLAESIDTGDIIAQQPVPIEPVDTGESLYRRLERTAVELFDETWARLRAGQAPRIPQNPAAGCSHRARDVGHIDEIELDRAYRARELIDLLRARTFPPHPGAYFRHDGRKVYLRLQLLWEDQLAESESDGCVHRD